MNLRPPGYEHMSLPAKWRGTSRNSGFPSPDAPTKYRPTQKKPFSEGLPSVRFSAPTAQVLGKTQKWRQIRWESNCPKRQSRHRPHACYVEKLPTSHLFRSTQQRESRWHFCEKSLSCWGTKNVCRIRMLRGINNHALYELSVFSNKYPNSDPCDAWFCATGDLCFFGGKAEHGQT